jgi:hypothetical protein
MRPAAPLAFAASLTFLLACTGPSGDDEASESSTSESSTSESSTSESSTSESSTGESSTGESSTGESSTSESSTGEPGEAGSLRFFGQGVAAPGLDRVMIRIDDPETAEPGPPIDVGAEDFTIELWLRAAPDGNATSPITCGDNVDWIYGNIVLDRDRYNQDRKFGLSLAGGEPVFGISGEGSGNLTICGGVDVRDDAWHHIAVQRRRSDGRLWMFVDGALVAEQDGPDGDVSYPDDGVPGDFCDGPCIASDPFVVLAAEKHDAGAEYPSFAGWLTNLRVSGTLRYAGAFTRPDAPFATDADTLALYRFDEGAGTLLGDVSGAAGGPSEGELRIGGDPAGPQWSSESPW